MTRAAPDDQTARRSRNLVRASVAAGVITAGLGIVPLSQPEPSPRIEPVALAGLVVLVVLGFAIGHRRLVLVLPAVVGAVVCVAAAFLAEPLHWRWSAGDFDAVADGQELSCTPRDPCDLGWWSVEQVTPDPQLPIVWLRPDATGSCYAGWGIARPGAGLGAAEARELAERRDDRRGFVEVRDWYDGWLELCYTT